ncbi:MAG: YeeE/YedE family protein [Methylomonas sp.]|nr:YeeE/YedE family protein [Methylomonas sp.]PPD21343.1 MAG: YeeE/YedE family protein [Methylomonas sp.]PPD26916.1 MAG: YeeE/YedE family protein [Methylomonas sp.]PPD38846.1 MAG: YeeE/YedE family protein [Methylomonas sp.]PPD41720.1 MAG: YeeE/YedE family protein [Methylomonas sp.]
MEHFTPVSALLGGALIGLSAVLLLWFNGRIAGISGIMSGLMATDGGNRQWRVAFLTGMLLGGAAGQLLMPDPILFRTDYPTALIIAGGFLVGFGTRLGNGCTSGHGICGIALGSKRSIVATLVFMATGLLTVFIMRHIVGLGA